MLWVLQIRAYSVSLSADGNTAIVGGYTDNSSAGAAWVFTRSGGVWTQQGTKLVGTGAVGAAFQGYSVSLASDGNTAIVGGNTDNSSVGAAWVFTRSGGVWTQQGAKLVGTGAVGAARQGFSVSLSADGNTAIVGGCTDNSSAGAAWVFTRSGGVWAQQGTKLVGTGAVGVAEQGFSVSLSADGNTAIVGGYTDNGGAGAAWVFTRSGGVWTQQGTKLVGTGAVGAADQGFQSLFPPTGIRQSLGGVLTTVLQVRHGYSRGAVECGLSRGRNAWAPVLWVRHVKADQSLFPPTAIWQSWVDMVTTVVQVRRGCILTRNRVLRQSRTFPSIKVGSSRTWDKSRGDEPPSTLVTEYWVWRGIRIGSAPGGATALSRKDYVGTHPHEGNILLGGDIYWQYMTSLPSHGLAHYSYACPTLADSTSEGIPWRYVFITAATSNPEIYWDSPPDSGYSVDNIAPRAPANAVLASLPDGRIRLSWSHDRTDPDVGHYAVYRSASGGFPIADSTRLQTTTDSTIVDLSTSVGNQYY